MFPPHIVLAAVDFSEPSRVALTFAARFANQCHAELHVLHAEDPLLAAAARARGVDLSSETRSELFGFIPSGGSTSGLAAHHYVVEGQPVEVICTVAKRESADVIVIGAHGISGVERMLFGSTAEGVLRKADTSVLMVPATWTPPRPETNDLTGIGPVVVGLELTPAAIAAGRAAGALAKLLHTSLEVRHVVPPLSVLSRWSAHADAAQSSRLEAARTQVMCALSHIEEVAAPHVDIESGPVAERLARALAATGDRQPLLVLGRRSPAERGGPPGSTAYRVLMLAQIPVLMVLSQQ